MEYKFKDYKEKQNHYKRICEERGKTLWISKSPKDAKGRTYINPDKKHKTSK